MGAWSKIEWTDHTFNPWVGCEKVSPACDHCYAEAWAKRAGSPELWQGQRRRTSAANWRGPAKWNREAAARGVRLRVFCASLADVFDNTVPEEWRFDLFALIAATPHLDWLLLTKRIGNAARMMDEALAGVVWGEAPLKNIWLGATIANQDEAVRDIPKLLRTPACVRFLSMEPLLERVDIHLLLCAGGIDWIIVGGESGGRARMMDPDWARSLHKQCKHNDVAFFMKQMTRKERIPSDLLVREFPRAAV